MQDENKYIEQRRLNSENSNKIVINESVLMRKIKLIQKYYLEVKKSISFFGSQSVNKLFLQNQIYELFFSSKFNKKRQSNTQNENQQQNQKKPFIVTKQQCKFTFLSQSLPKNNSNNQSFIVIQNQMSKNNYQNMSTLMSHYYGQTLEPINYKEFSTSDEKNSQIQNPNPIQQNEKCFQDKEKAFFHGYGLLIYFQTFKNLLISQLPNFNFIIHFYAGYFINNLKHGYGLQAKQSQDKKNLQIYIGNYSNGKYDDEFGIWLKKKINLSQNELQDKNKLDDSEKYFGTFQNGMKHGKGKFYSKQVFYDGQWRFNKPQGIGQIWTSSSYYQGRFKCGLKHGIGKQSFKNGDIYQGQYTNNKPGGLGKYIWRNNGLYEGQFKNGLRNGKGLWKSESESYQGMYQNDKKCGQGIYYWKNGQTYYKGSFYDDLRQGYGQMHWENQTSIYKGTWKEGLQDGFGEVFQMNKTKNELKIVNKGQFSKGNLVESYIQKNSKSSLQFKSSQSLQSLQSQHNGFSRQKSPVQHNQQSFNQKNLKHKQSSNHKIFLNKNPHQKSKKQSYDMNAILPQISEKQVKRKLQNLQKNGKLIKSENQLFFNKEKRPNPKQIETNNKRYLNEKSNIVTSREHLYGQVYLIKSGKKRALSSFNIKGEESFKQKSLKSRQNKVNKNISIQIKNRNKNKSQKIIEIQEQEQQNKQRYAARKYILMRQQLKGSKKMQNQRQKGKTVTKKNEYLEDGERIGENLVIREKVKEQINLQPLIEWKNFYKSRKRKQN